jgi:Protein of unknown function (DUF3175)
LSTTEYDGASSGDAAQDGALRRFWVADMCDNAFRPLSRSQPMKACAASFRTDVVCKVSGFRRQDGFWTAEVTRRSNALDLEPNVFTLSDPREIARSLKLSAEASQRRKSPSFRSAMSMLTFYINRAGKGLSEERRDVLERAKIELRKEFGRS